jgi:hypothetical protein
VVSKKKIIARESEKIDSSCSHFGNKP